MQKVVNRELNYICQMSMTIEIDFDIPSKKKRGCFYILASWIMRRFSRFRKRHVQGCMSCLYVDAYRRRSYDRFMQEDSALYSDRDESPDQSDCITLPELPLRTDIDCHTAICKDCDDTESYLSLSPVTSDIPHEFNIANLPDALTFTGESAAVSHFSGSLSSSLTDVTSASSSLSDDFESWCLSAKRSIPQNHHRWFDKYETTCLLDTRANQEDEEMEDEAERHLIIVHNERQREVWEDENSRGDVTKTRGYMG